MKFLFVMDPLARLQIAGDTGDGILEVTVPVKALNTVP